VHAVRMMTIGGPNVLKYEQVADPTPKAGQVLVKVHACGVCGFDCRTREGLPGYHTPPGTVLGHEFAGDVVALGAGVTEFAIGDRLTVVQQGYCGTCEYCMSGRHTICPNYHETTYGSEGLPGGYADLVVVEVKTAVKVPPGVSYRDAAIAACGIGVSLHALNRVGARMGHRVLVTGAGGGLGIHALQLARIAGCHVIAATTSEAKAEHLRKYADDVILYRNGKFELDGERPDIIVENTAGHTLPASLRTIKRGGKIVIAGMVGTDPVPFMPGPFFAREIELIGSNATTKHELQEVLRLLAQKKIEAVVSHELPLSEAAKAHQMLDAGVAFGRVVLIPDGIGK